MDDYLTKPLDAIKLIEMLDAMVETLAGIYANEGTIGQEASIFATSSEPTLGR